VCSFGGKDRRSVFPRERKSPGRNGATWDEEEIRMVFRGQKAKRNFLSRSPRGKMKFRRGRGKKKTSPACLLFRHGSYEKIRAKD